MKMQNQGFTLIEIAIVLVIIGLLAGGILKGQQMIENAKYKAWVKQIDSYRVAIATFQDRYHYYPGDYPYVDRLPSYVPGVAGFKGDGNGAINASTTVNLGNTVLNESANAVCHLMLAGLIPGTCDGSTGRLLPTTPVGGHFGFFTTATIANSKGRLYFDGIPSSMAKRLDEEFDDGKSNTGGIVDENGLAAWGDDRTVDMYIAL